MITGYFIKHPLATKSYEFDFAPDMADGDSVSGYTLTVTDSEGVDATADILSIASLTATTLVAEFIGGDDGQNYLIVVIANLTDDISTPTKIVEMRVRSSGV